MLTFSYARVEEDAPGEPDRGGEVQGVLAGRRGEVSQLYLRTVECVEHLCERKCVFYLLSNLVLLLLQLQLPPLEVGELELLLGGHHLGRGGVGMLLLLELLLLPQLLLHLSLLLLELSLEALLLLLRCTACLKKYHHSR